jgi:hypothetical protein
MGEHCWYFPTVVFPCVCGIAGEVYVPLHVLKIPTFRLAMWLCWMLSGHLLFCYIHVITDEQKAVLL